MKIAVFSESQADEAAIRVFVAGLLEAEIQPAAMPRIPTRGWPSVLRTLPDVLATLHYRTDADGLVIVVDSDLSLPHQKAHASQRPAPPDCRLCSLLVRASEILSGFRPKSGRAPLRLAVGVAVPAIEAWYLAGRQDAKGVSETAWILGHQTRKFPYTKQHLKELVYGTSKPSLPVELPVASQEARRIVQERKLPLLEKLFPSGFGPLGEAVRSWKSGPSG